MKQTKNKITNKQKRISQPITLYGARSTASASNRKLRKRESASTEAEEEEEERRAVGLFPAEQVDACGHPPVSLEQRHKVLPFGAVISFCRRPGKEPLVAFSSSRGEEPTLNAVFFTNCNQQVQLPLPLKELRRQEDKQQRNKVLPKCHRARHPNPTDSTGLAGQL